MPLLNSSIWGKSLICPDQNFVMIIGGYTGKSQGYLYYTLQFVICTVINHRTLYQITPQIFTVREKAESTIGGGDIQLMGGGIITVLMNQGQKHG